MAGPVTEMGAPGATAALFLDRDGVLNHKAPEGRYVADEASFRFLPGAVDALALVRRTVPEVALIVTTNQRGIARGIVTEAVVAAIHKRMSDELERHGVRLDGIYVCPHERGSCDCRKPRSGLFLQAQRDLPGLRFADSRMVGDALADLQAAAAVGIPAFLVGPAPSRAVKLAAARAQGIPVAGEAQDLLGLVRGKEMTEWLAGITPVVAVQ